MMNSGTWRDIRNGGAVGISFGLALSLWATVVYVLGGAEAFAEKDTTYGAMVAAYLGGGLAAGLLVGTLRKWRTTGVGKLAVGVAAAVPVAIAMRIAIRGFVPWETIDSLAVLIVTAIWGIGGALIFWKD